MLNKIQGQKSRQTFGMSAYATRSVRGAQLSEFVKNKKILDENSEGITAVFHCIQPGEAISCVTFKENNSLKKIITNISPTLRVLIGKLNGEDYGVPGSWFKKNSALIELLESAKMSLFS